MKTIMVFLLAFTLGGIANAQLVRKKLALPTPVNAAQVCHKKTSGTRSVDKKQLHHMPVKFDHREIKSLPVERKEK